MHDVCYYVKYYATFWICVGVISLDYAGATSWGPMCHTKGKMLHLIQSATCKICIFESDKWSCDRHLYFYVDPFDVHGLSFGIGICNMYSKSPMGDLCDMSSPTKS